MGGGLIPSWGRVPHMGQENCTVQSCLVQYSPMCSWIFFSSPVQSYIVLYIPVQSCIVLSWIVICSHVQSFLALYIPMKSSIVLYSPVFPKQLCNVLYCHKQSFTVHFHCVKSSAVIFSHIQSCYPVESCIFLDICIQLCSILYGTV